MASPAGARAEIGLRQRHRAAWPDASYAFDLDEVRVVTGRTVLLEVPRGTTVLTAEYKAVDDGPLDLGDLQFRVVADTARDDLPAFVVQFTHPECRPPQPWAFRLFPMNPLARRIAEPGVILTEQSFVQLHYVILQGITAGGGITVGAHVARTDLLGRNRHPGVCARCTAPVEPGGGFLSRRHDRWAVWCVDCAGRPADVDTWVAPWEPLSHLDGTFPPPNVWPVVTGPTRWETPARRHFDEHIVRRFLAEHGQTAEATDRPVATVTTLVRDRVALGAYRRPPAPPPSRPAPVSLARDRATDDAWSQTRILLKLRYRDMWEDERASEDNRDPYRAWNGDGSRRWAGVR